MTKLLAFLNKNILKFGISFLLVFIALYPKLPSININHTWVYIRLEDFLILGIVLVWFIQLLLKKVNLHLKFTWPILLYWLVGLGSLIYSIVFIAPSLANYFSNVAILSYLRRVEYMILFFVALSTVKSIKDLKDYVKILLLTVLAFSLYGLGQHFYHLLWGFAPDLYAKYKFCFPSFQTGNEEFAKGIPLCLSENGRVTSTFAGHYDLSAYLVLVLPIFVGLFAYVKKTWRKALILLLIIFANLVLIFTSSRVSFIAYFAGISAALIFLNKKRLIPVFIILNIVLATLFSQAMVKRFAQTFRLTSVVTDNQGYLIGETLSPELQAKLAKQKLVLENIPTQNLPEGSGFIGLPQKNQATDSALVKRGLTIEEARRLKLANGGVEISTMSGSFLVKKVLVYDISFTTRFQAEWPNAIKAFLRNPLSGSGFATITLASDNDFLRMLGETGVLGLVSFLSIFAVFGILLKDSLRHIKSNLAKVYLLGLSGGVIGLFLNAGLIDVFEASKVAETLWILLGIGVGTVLLYKKDFPLFDYFKKIISSNVLIIIYLLVLTGIYFLPSSNMFFIGDDFTWLKWSANSTTSDLPGYFINSQGFFYRPLPKTIMYFLYSAFSFKPLAFHLFIWFIHFLIGAIVYFVSKKLFNSKIIAFITAFVFLFIPAAGETNYWISTISISLSSLFIVIGLLLVNKFRTTKSALPYILALIFAGLSLVTYEMAVIFPLLVLVIDWFKKVRRDSKYYISLIPFSLLIPGYLLLRAFSQTVEVGGSYSYSLVHAIPNIFGNIFGYFGLMIFSKDFIAIYDFLRISLRQQIAASIFIAIVGGLAIYLLIPRARKLLQKEGDQRVLIFGLIFAIASLSVYLPMGNISDRYFYLATVGFAISAGALIGILSKRFSKNKKIIIVSAGILIALVYSFQRNHVKNDWNNASRITNRTLAYLRLYHEGDITKKDNFYFANVPIKKGQAWIYPVGLEDGIWFIYREKSPSIYKIGSLSELKQVKNEKGSGSADSKNYFFYFDNNGNMEELK